MTKASGPAYQVPYRRRRSGKTNFTNRLALIKSGQTRLVVRRSNKNILVQFINFDPLGDKTLLSVSGAHLSKGHNWPSKRNIWTGYLVGVAAGKAAQKKGIKNFVVDLGLYTPSNGSILFAVLKGVMDSGLETNCGEDKFPTEKLSNPPESIKSNFEHLKNKLLSG